MLFWIMIIALALGVALALLRPLWRAQGAAEGRGAYDMRVYRDQLAELERDETRGILSADEAERARLEISRRILGASRNREAIEGATPRAASMALPVLILAALAAGFGIYAWLGAPGLKDSPIAARVAAANAIYDERPDQARAEEEMGPAIPAQGDSEAETRFAGLMTQLRAAVAERPDDPEGLRFLAENEARLGDFRAAYDAQTRRLAALGEDAQAEDWAILGELKARAAGGLITAEAEEDFAAALRMDPTNGRARFYIGLLMAQNGRPDRAFPVWDQLLRDSPASAPWVPIIQGSISDLAWFAGEASYTPPAPRAIGPSRAELEAAATLPAPARETALRAPIEALNRSMAQNGGSAGEWAALIGGLALLGDTARAEAIYEEARARFAERPEMAAEVDRGAALGGLIPAPETDTAPLPGPSAEDMANAAQMSDADRQEMIAGMVTRLETRLFEAGGDGAEWARLFTTLGVLDQPARASAAWARARRVFADDPATLASLRAAAAAAGADLDAVETGGAP